MEQRHYRRIREKALADAQTDISPKPDRAKPILLIVCLILLAVAIFGLVKWVMPDPDRFAEVPREVGETIDVGLSTNDMEALLTGFLMAKTVEEQLEFVDHPEISEPRMRKFYEDGHAELPLRAGLIKISPFVYDGEEHMGAMVQLFGAASMVPFLVDEDGLPKLEWEAVMGWMDPTWEEILEAKPEESVEVKVFAIMDDYYNRSYRDESKWFCVRLSNRDLTRHCYAYFDRKDTLLAPLLNLRSDRLSPVTLKLKFGAGREFSQAEITGFRSYGWTAD